jgi:hypothetical protein
MLSQFKFIFLILTLATNNFLAAELTPGSTFYVGFPKLGKTWAKKDARMGVYIPKDYTPEKSYPLVVWYGGGLGSDSPNQAKRMVGEKGFICVGVPYHFADDNIQGAWSHTTWSYYNTMLSKLEKLVPNINHKNKICSGFSSGGAAIMSLIGRSVEFRNYFHAFMPGGSGWDMGGLAELKGRPMYIFMGDKDSRVSSYDTLSKDAKAAGIDITYLRFKGGHGMPTKHFEEMRQWIQDKVIFRALPELRKSISKDFKAKKYAQAYQSAKEILSITEAGTDIYQEAEKVFAHTKPFGEQMTKKILSSKVNLPTIKKFLLEWQGADFVQPLKDKCTAIAAGQLKKIVSQKVISATYLKRFILYWEDFEISGEAMEEFDSMATASLEKMLASRNNNSSKYKSLERFIKDWVPSEVIEKAQEAQEKLATEELEEILKLSSSRQKSKLKSFGRYFPDSQAAEKAQALLKK